MGEEEFFETMHFTIQKRFRENVISIGIERSDILILICDQPTKDDLTKEMRSESMWIGGACRR